MGTKTSPLWAGFARVTTETAYEAERGYGWVKSSRKPGAFVADFTDALAADHVNIRASMTLEFRQYLPKERFCRPDISVGEVWRKCGMVSVQRAGVQSEGRSDENRVAEVRGGASSHRADASPAPGGARGVALTKAFHDLRMGEPRPPWRSGCVSMWRESFAHLTVCGASSPCRPLSRTPARIRLQRRPTLSSDFSRALFSD